METFNDIMNSSASITITIIEPANMARPIMDPLARPIMNGEMCLIMFVYVFYLTNLLLNIINNSISAYKNRIIEDMNNTNRYNENRKTPIIISIEGNIGTGKSTLIDKLQKHFEGDNVTHLKIGFIPEPVDIWNSVTDNKGVTILEKYYNDQYKYAFPFQMMAYISRLSIMRNAIKNGFDIIFIERSMFTDCEVFAKMLYDDGKIEEIEYNIYMRWFNEFIGDFPNLWHIYVQAEPQVSFNRVVKRNRTGENIPLSYLEKCHQYHENWLLKDQIVPTLLLNGNKDMDEDYSEWLEKIKEFIL
jgi:deoxyadenosine/deoxycytidine kinase